MLKTISGPGLGERDATALQSRTNTEITSTMRRALLDSGYSDVVVVRGQICAVKRFNFTTALVVGIGIDAYARRYCYEHRAEARQALMAWNGDAHPPGPWIKCKGAGIDLLNPEFE